jgi:hypothetical protein
VSFSGFSGMGMRCPASGGTTLSAFAPLPLRLPESAEARLCDSAAPLLVVRFFSPLRSDCS